MSIPHTAPKAKILIIGPIPPPYHGVSLSTQLILTAPGLNPFHLIHLNTTDQRSIINIGKFELGNIALAGQHAAQFLWLLRQHRPHLVYLPISQGTPGYLRDALFMLPAIWLKIPVVVHLRGSELLPFYQQAPRFVQSLIRYTLGRVASAIVLGERLRTAFGTLVPPSRIAVIPNGTPDFVPQNPPIRKQPNKIQGLYLSNLRARKGVFVALQAAVIALQTFPALEFVFAGEIEEEPTPSQIEALLQDCPVRHRLHLVGTVTGYDKEQLLLASDFLVFPPLEPEGHPRVILEAMAASLPIITTDQGAIAETVLDQQTGFIVPSNDVQSLVEKIRLLTERPLLRQQMGQAARERFLTHYTAEAANQKLGLLFQSILDTTPP